MSDTPEAKSQPVSPPRLRRVLALSSSPRRRGNSRLLAEAVLDPQAQVLLARGFEKVEAEQGPAAFIELAEAEVDRLAAALGA